MRVRDERRPLLMCPFPATSSFLRRRPTTHPMRPAAPTRDFLGRPRKDLKPMQTKTALAVAGTVLAVPSTALAATAHDTDTAGQDALRASGRLTLDADHKAGLVRENLRLARRAARLGDRTLRRGHTRRVRDDSVSVIRLRNRRLHRRVARLQRRPTPPRPPHLSSRRSPPVSPAATRHEHRQRLLRQVPVHAVDLAERRRHRQPRRAPEAEQDRRAAQLSRSPAARPGPSAVSDALAPAGLRAAQVRGWSRELTRRRRGRAPRSSRRTRRSGPPLGGRGGYLRGRGRAQPRTATVHGSLLTVAPRRTVSPYSPRP